MRILLVFILLWTITSSVVLAPGVRAVFAVQVHVQANSQLYLITAYLNNGRTLTHQKFMSKDEFAKFASGKWPSIYNPNRLNLLQENNLLCGLAKDSITGKDVVYCSPLDSLWKIRFSDYPFNNGKEKGWSPELYKPSLKQALYLQQRYGVSDLDVGVFIDSSFWKIMRDVQDTMWIKQYKAMK